MMKYSVFIMFLLINCSNNKQNLLLGSWKMKSIQHMQQPNPYYDSTSLYHDVIIKFTEKSFYINNKYVGEYVTDEFKNITTTIKEEDFLRKENISWESKCYNISNDVVKYSLNDSILTLFTNNLYAKFIKQQ